MLRNLCINLLAARSSPVLHKLQLPGKSWRHCRTFSANAFSVQMAQLQWSFVADTFDAGHNGTDTESAFALVVLNQPPTDLFPFWWRRGMCNRDSNCTFQAHCGISCHEGLCGRWCYKSFQLRSKVVTIQMSCS